MNPTERLQAGHQREAELAAILEAYGYKVDRRHPLSDEARWHLIDVDSHTTLRYWPDLIITARNGDIAMIEVKGELVPNALVEVAAVEAYRRLTIVAPLFVTWRHPDDAFWYGLDGRNLTDDILGEPHQGGPGRTPYYRIDPGDLVRLSTWL